MLEAQTKPSQLWSIMVALLSPASNLTILLLLEILKGAWTRLLPAKVNLYILFIYFLLCKLWKYKIQLWYFHIVGSFNNRVLA